MGHKNLQRGLYVSPPTPPPPLLVYFYSVRQHKYYSLPIPSHLYLLDALSLLNLFVRLRLLPVPLLLLLYLHRLGAGDAPELQNPQSC